MDHDKIWYAIDMLAKQKGISTSGLAKLAGLDPTTFNKSKRVGSNGKKRWPSTESLARVLEVTETSLAEIMPYVYGTENEHCHRANKYEYGFPLQEIVENCSQVIRIFSVDKANKLIVSDSKELVPKDDNPQDEHDFIEHPLLHSHPVCALEISNNDFSPVYRKEDKIVICLLDSSQQIRKGDRLVIKTINGEIKIREKRKKYANKLELAFINNEEGNETLNFNEVEWIARILWASQ